MLRSLALVAVLAGSASPSFGNAADTTHVRITTELGDILLALLPDQAPLTVANFIAYVNAGHYEGGSFFRTVRADNQPNNEIKIAVVQAGVHPWMENFSLPPIPLERTSDTGILHLDGTVSMARGGPDTATWSFFVCIGDQPDLDFGGRRNPDGQGFAAFGQVVEGMDVVHRIHRMRANGQAILPPVQILGAHVESP